MKEHHKKVLDALIEDYEGVDGGAFFCFKVLCKKTGLDRRTVRLACRYLKRKGLARFGTGLCDNDGAFYGSGYSASEEAMNQAAYEAGVKSNNKKEV